MRLRPLLRQLEIGMSISRYLAASGTAGFERMLVSGRRRVPCPPPNTTATEFFMAVVPEIKQKRSHHDGTTGTTIDNRIDRIAGCSGSTGSICSLRLASRCDGTFYR